MKRGNDSTNRFTRLTQVIEQSPGMKQWSTITVQWQRDSRAGVIILSLGIIFITLFIFSVNLITTPLPNPGLLYLPLVAMLAYHWGWRHALIGGILQIVCAYYIFTLPAWEIKPLTDKSIEQLVTLAAVTGFTLTLVQLARNRRSVAEHQAERSSALNRVGTALASELDEKRLLHLIAETACNLTGAKFAAFTLRPVDEMGQPLVPSEGNLFYLAAVVGVSPEEETLFRRMPLGGEGLLAPIFRHGVAVRVPDALAVMRGNEHFHSVESQSAHTETPKENARDAAFAYAHGLASKDALRTLGVPRGHPMVRSFLGAPLLDRHGEVRGGLLLGHTQPDRFTEDDEVLLVGLAAQAAVALENARLYRAAQTQAQELDAIFQSIADGVTVIDYTGKIVRENTTARYQRDILKGHPDKARMLDELLFKPAQQALQGEVQQGIAVTTVDGKQEAREYLVSASPLRPKITTSGGLSQRKDLRNQQEEDFILGAVVVWHDVTEARKLLVEQRAHAETAAQLALLQMIIDELPSGVYLVRGKDARLVLANHATTEVFGAAWSPGQMMAAFLAASGIKILRADGRPLAIEDFAILHTLQTGEAVRHQQEIIRHADGTALPVLINAVAIDPSILGWSKAENEEPDNTMLEPAAIVVLQDVSALKEAERLKDEFIGIAAHELRSPLAALKGFAQMLIRQTARGKGPKLADWQQEAIEAIDQATIRLVELTEDLLDVTRLQGGRLELHIEPTDLTALVRRVISRLTVTTDHHMITILADSEPVIVNIDRQRIEQVLSNLVNNAIKYSPDGGAINVKIQEKAQSSEAWLSVCDEGIGIPTEQQGRIFGRFVRADNAREFKGTGLGLYLCRELVERHDGRIWFESVEGKGSTFFVTLPLALDIENNS